MRDWPGLVEERLRGLALEPQEKAEIITELAAHLEDISDAMSRQGVSESEAVERALSQVGSWRSLQSNILAAKRREYFMRTRARQLWIPGLLTMTLSTLLLIVLQKGGFRAQVIGGGADTVPLYWPWLVSLPFLGALGAYISVRAGGSRAKALLASVFPAAALASAFLLMAPIGFAIQLVTQRNVDDFQAVAVALLRDGLGWIVVPAIALLVGGLLVQSVTGRGASKQQVAT